MFELAIEHDHACAASPHRTRDEARTELLAYLDASGCDYQIAQACPDHSAYTLTDAVDGRPGRRIVGLAVIENLATARRAELSRGHRG